MNQIADSNFVAACAATPLLLLIILLFWQHKRNHDRQRNLIKGCLRDLRDGFLNDFTRLREDFSDLLRVDLVNMHEFITDIDNEIKKLNRFARHIFCRKSFKNKKNIGG